MITFQGLPPRLTRGDLAVGSNPATIVIRFRFTTGRRKAGR